MAASLDRKYLRFLRVAPEKQPVPTPQFRSYRKPSPSPSPTATAPPVTLPPTPYWLDGSKPPPRPPNESKPASPFKPQPSPSVTKDLMDSNGSSFDFSSPIQPKHHPNPAGRHSAERSAPRSNPSDAINAFRKSISTSKLPSSHNQPPNLHTTPEMAMTELLEEKEKLMNKNSSSLRRPSSRRHSIEIIDTKSPVKPQLAPKPNSARHLGRNVLIESSSNTSSLDTNQRRAMYGSLNRSSYVEMDIYGSLETGYAKIKPRNASNASDYHRSNSVGSSVILSSPNKTESVGRRSSVSSSRRSSTDCGTVKSGGASSSLSKLPSPSTCLSPASPNRGIFDFNLDSFGYVFIYDSHSSIMRDSILRSTGSCKMKGRKR